MTDTPAPASPAATEMERRIGEAFDQFENIYVPELPAEHRWLFKQRLGRLCEEVVRRATPDPAALRAERDRLRGLVERLSDAAGGLSQGIRMINQDGPVMEVCVMVEAIRNEARAALAEGRADG